MSEVGAPAGRPDDQFDASFARKVAEALNDPFTQMQMLRPFLDYLSQFIAVAGIPVPVGQVIGFQQFLAQPATAVGNADTTTSTSFVALANAGPTIAGLPDGEYLILFGALMKVSVAGKFAFMGVRVNSTDPSTADSAQTTDSEYAHCSYAVVETLDAGGNNTLSARYRSDDDGLTTATFGNRWMIALRTANA